MRHYRRTAVGCGLRRNLNVPCWQHPVRQHHRFVIGARAAGNHGMVRLQRRLERSGGWVGGWVGVGHAAPVWGMLRRAANVPGARRVADRQRARAGIGRDIGAGARRDWLRHVSGHAPACSGWSSALVRLQLVSLHRTRNQGGSRSTAGEAGPMHRRHAVLRCRITEVPHALHPPTLSPTLSLSLSLSLSL